MLPASMAFTWVVWRQHRWGLGAVLGYVLFSAALSAVFSPFCTPSTAQGVLSLLVAVAVSAIPVMLLGIFAYGFDGADLLACESCFPPRLFRLPMPTRSLVVWPMVVGASSAILLYLAFAWMVLRPWLDRLGEPVPFWWPAMFLATALAWVQALMWTPLGLPWLRLVLLIALIPAMIALGIFAATCGASEVLLVGLCVVLMMLGWSVAYVGVQQARRGNVPDWAWIFLPLRWHIGRPPQRRAPFSSPARAQAWFHWQLTGKTFPIIVALMLPLVLWPLFFGGRSGEFVEMAICYGFAAPVFLAGIARPQPRSGLMASIATLPIGTADLVGAILKSAAVSTLATWALVFMVVPAAVVLTGNLDTVFYTLRYELRDLHPVQITAGFMAFATLLVVWTWKRRVDRLCLAMTGRKWIEATLGWVFIPGYYAFFGTSWGILESFNMSTNISGLVTVVLLCRVLATIWALKHVVQRGLVRPSTVIRGVIQWLLLASLLIVVLAWCLAPNVVPVYYVVLGVPFALPMARLAAMPLALAWNRHR